MSPVTCIILRVRCIYHIKAGDCQVDIDMCFGFSSCTFQTILNYAEKHNGIDTTLLTASQLTGM